VRERRAEIGILRAIGVSGPKVAALFLGKAVLLGLVGAVFGFALGTALALWAGPVMFEWMARRMAPDYALLVWSAIAAPLLAALASYIPAMVAVAQDPAVVLREE